MISHVQAPSRLVRYKCTYAAPSNVPSCNWTTLQIAGRFKSPASRKSQPPYCSVSQCINCMVYVIMNISLILETCTFCLLLSLALCITITSGFTACALCRRIHLLLHLRIHLWLGRPKAKIDACVLKNLARVLQL